MLEAGERIDVWIVEEPLGVGGTASVYRCHQADSEQIVGAVKVLDDLASHREDAQQRFIREAEVLFGLDHPGIVGIRGVCADHAPPYLVMEYVEGRSLAEIVSGGALPLDRALDILQELAEAVSYLHDRGVRHRDLKPANILIREDGSVCIVDFGLVLEAGRTRLTAEGIRMGTVSYVPPEWATPSRINPVAWDIYALGTVTWEMLTGERAFPGQQQLEDGPRALQVIADKQGHQPLDPGLGFRQPLRDLIRRMTYADPSERPKAQEVADVCRSLSRTYLPAGEEGEGMPTLDGFAILPTSDQGVLPTLGLELAALAPAPAAEKVGVEPGPPPPSVPPAAPSGPSSPSRPPQRSLPLLGLAVAAVAGTSALAMVVAMAVAWLVWPPAATHRPAQIIVTGLSSGTPYVVEISGQTSVRRAGWTLTYDSLPLGELEMVWAVGEGCSVETCGESCVCGSREIQLDAGDGPWTDTLALHAPTVKVPDLPEAPPEAPPDPPVPPPSADPDPPPTRSSGVATRGEFAAWLAEHPAWFVDAATSRGEAGPGYLSGWTGTEPPRPGPMTHVTWYAAAAFCERRGGLSGVDDPPARWEGSPFMEWRQIDGKMAWRSGDNRSSDAADPLQASASLGLRCRN